MANKFLLHNYSILSKEKEIPVGYYPTGTLFYIGFTLNLSDENLNILSFITTCLPSYSE